MGVTWMKWIPHLKFFSGYPQSKLSSENEGWTAVYRRGLEWRNDLVIPEPALSYLPVVDKLSLA